MDYRYLLQSFFPGGYSSGLQADHGSQQGEGLILGKADVGVVMQTKDLRGVIDGQTTNECQVTLESEYRTVDHSLSKFHQ